MQAMEALSSESLMDQLQASIEYTSQLVDATTGRTVSLLPADLWVANVILDLVVSIQEETVSSQNESIITNPDEVCKTNNIVLYLVTI